MRWHKSRDNGVKAGGKSPLIPWTAGQARASCALLLTMLKICSYPTLLENNQALPPTTLHRILYALWGCCCFRGPWIYTKDIARKGGNNVASLLMHHLDHHGISITKEPYMELKFVLDIVVERTSTDKSWGRYTSLSIIKMLLLLEPSFLWRPHKECMQQTVQHNEKAIQEDKLLHSRWSTCQHRREI